MLTTDVRISFARTCEQYQSYNEQYHGAGHKMVRNVEFESE